MTNKVDYRPPLESTCVDEVMNMLIEYFLHTLLQLKREIDREAFGLNQWKTGV